MHPGRECIPLTCHFHPHHSIDGARESLSVRGVIQTDGKTECFGFKLAPLTSALLVVPAATAAPQGNA
jgi:hypothetical protein